MTTKFRQNLGKREIITKLTSVIGFSSKNIQKITEDIIETIISNLVYHKKINLKNLGTFNVIFKDKREGRNPKTKEIKIISERNVILFKPSKDFKKFINNNGD